MIQPCSTFWYQTRYWTTHVSLNTIHFYQINYFLQKMRVCGLLEVWVMWIGVWIQFLIWISLMTHMTSMQDIWSHFDVFGTCCMGEVISRYWGISCNLKTFVTSPRAIPYMYVKRPKTCLVPKYGELHGLHGGVLISLWAFGYEIFLQMFIYIYTHCILYICYIYTVWLLSACIIRSLYTPVGLTCNWFANVCWPR